MAEGGDVEKAKRRKREERRENDISQYSSSTVQQPFIMYHQPPSDRISVEEDTSRRRNMLKLNNNACTSDRKGVVAVVGVGPGLGYSIAQRFVHEGYTVAIFARNKARLESFVKDIAEKETNALLYAIRVDCSDLKEVKQAFESVRSFGFVELLVYNVNSAPEQPSQKFMDIDPERFQQSLTLPSLGAFFCAQQVLPGMLEKKKGTIIFTGSSASVQGQQGAAETACGKFALRALAQCLAREFQPQGIHVAHVIVDGPISSMRKREGEDEKSKMNPEAIAEAYWHIHMQDQGAWTHELDLRPVTLLPIVMQPHDCVTAIRRLDTDAG
ncbi:hypothetical protein GOP47_0009352 [Adiantum capillus-veneris]|uniref:Uncharacterized protein n=1 Tax=Adiantum capillus-veneris TaxID=13818 RepID=A0A9D4UWL3_ADICA|nr:hypothetical protein GOP47_0009352 [Adiantum capillus-veneris]